MDNKVYDIAIIGAGPGGLTAAIYGLRSARSVVIIEKMTVGGQISLTGDIENYPGYENITGFELSMKMHDQAVKLGAEIVYAEVTHAELEGKVKKLTTTDGEVMAKTVIVSTGAKARKLGLNNEDKFTGSGVAYCALCDGAFYKGKTVALIGGGNTAVEDAIYLSKIAKHVIMVNNLPKFTAQAILLKELEHIMSEHNNITVYHNSTLQNINGNQFVESVEIKHVDTKDITTHTVEGVFIAIGRVPDTEFLKGKLNLNPWGYIVTDELMNTNVAGVFACGDVREKQLRQIVTATSDGAMAATSANSYIGQTL